MKRSSAAAIASIFYLRSRGVAVENTVAPSHDYEGISPNVGDTATVTPGTWTPPSTVLTYQWRRNGVDIGGETGLTYEFVDADFGLTVDFIEIPNGDTDAAVASAATGAVAEAPSQTLGAELLTNGDFSAWTGNSPDGWTVNGVVGNDPEVTQVGAGQGHGGGGTGLCNLYASATSSAPNVIQSVLVANSFYEIGTLVDTVVAGGVNVTDAAVSFVTYTTTGSKRFLGRAAGTGFRYRGSAASSNVTIDNASVKLVTRNAQLTAPSANMQLTFNYTLPGTPIEGTTVWLLPRVSDFAAGNYWLGWLRYTGSQWDVNVYSVATHTRTSRISATGIGATDGIRINMNGDSISLYTHAAGAWTQRGSTVSFSTYNTSVGCNVLHTSDVTAGTLEYAAAA